jgi:hypothetical protein
MTQASKLLYDKVVRFAKEELKKIGHYGHLSKKLHAAIKAKEHGITKTAIFFWYLKRISDIMDQASKRLQY